MGSVSQQEAKPLEYVRPVRPLYFPVAAEVPETQRHLELRTALYQLLRLALDAQHSVGSDQFVYYDASDPGACLAPDVFVKLTGGAEEITSWKVWERGTPELAVEFVSRSDAPDAPWADKLKRYHRLGVRELVRFEQHAANPIRIWDYVDGDLVERRVSATSPALCRVLGWYWVVGRDERWGPTLRLATDPEGGHLIQTEKEVRADAERRAIEATQREAEAAQREAEAAQREAEAAQREAESAQREALARKSADEAHERVKELEAALALAKSSRQNS
jgi:hypothetical protein